MKSGMFVVDISMALSSLATVPGVELRKSVAKNAPMAQKIFNELGRN